FLLPSVKEGWGMVVTEAAACGTPAIVSNVTGLRDSVRDGKTGIILSANPTPEELAGTMIQLIEQPQGRKNMSKQEVIWTQKLDWRTSYEQFRELLLRKP